VPVIFAVGMAGGGERLAHSLPPRSARYLIERVRIV